MKHSLLIIFLLGFLSGCQSDPKPSTSAEKEQKQNRTNCVFEQPDLAFAGIQLLDTASTKTVFGNQIKLKAKPHFYLSGDKLQYTKLIVHPGDLINAVSIFKVGFTNEALKSSKNKTIQQPFVSGNGIFLGMPKSQVINKLGKCFSIKNQRRNSLVLLYRIEQPQDTKDGLLKRHNLPVYYATYKFWDDKLTEMEFGFEYP